MTEKEKQILESLNSAARDIEIPESLEPENIETKLAAVKGRRWKRSYTFGLAAACLAVLIGGAYIWQSAGKGMEADNGEAKSGTEISDQIASAGDYKDVYKYIQRYQEERQSAVQYAEDATMGEADTKFDSGSNTQSAAGAENGNAKQMESSVEDSASAHSDTNVRTEGVGEADIVKTDGTYLYALKENAAEIAVVDPSGDTMKELAVIRPGRDAQISEFYVDGSSLFILCNVPKAKVDEDEVSFYYGEDAVMFTYDLSDIEHPALKASVSQSGRYLTSRFVDGYLYLFSSFSVDGNCKAEDQDSYIPKINEKLIAEADIILPPVNRANQYTVVTSIKADDPRTILDEKAVLAANGQCYVSGSNIYLYESVWKDARSRSLLSGSSTAIRRISYEKGTLKGEAQGKVNGYIHDSFCIDEYDGYLRVVTTTDSGTESTNAVYVLDGEMKTKGKITNLANGEQVYSARLLGKTGYFVTYRQTDPLFSVDFSDPENPEIIGKLKIPGFSEYLHLYDDGLLLGIGMDTDEESGVTNGLKICMFDISDPSDVKEVQKYTVKGAYSSDVFFDYRAVLIDKERNMIGFSAYGNNEIYYIFSYDKTNGFNLEMEEEVNGASYLGTRGIYIKDRLYVVKGNAIESYQIGEYTKIDDLLL